MEMPQEFQARMTALLGADAPRFFQALDTPACRAFRFDPNRVEKSLLADAFGAVQALPFGENACFFSHDGIGSHPLHHGGALYVQEPAAMAPVAALPHRKFRRILDLCAAPGGKSLQAAATRLCPDGLLVCNEPDGRRRAALMQNIERMGEGRAVVTGFDATRLPEEFVSAFDLVICDAPCSGEGMMRKSPEVARLWSQKHVLELALLQEKILASAVRALAAGGVLLYSTCTWSVEENEAQVCRVLDQHPDLTLLSPDEAVASVATGGVALEGKEFLSEKTLRFYPHRFDGEGQFLAVFARSGETAELPVRSGKEKKKKEKPHPDEETVRRFVEEHCAEAIPYRLLCRGDSWYLVRQNAFPDELFLQGGVPVGQVQKGRVLPHHSFFKCLRLRREIKLCFAEAERYLHGEELPLSAENGFATVLYGRCPLGGVRVAGGRGKNLYPKGLRK